MRAAYSFGSESSGAANLPASANHFFLVLNTTCGQILA